LKLQSPGFYNYLMLKLFGTVLLLLSFVAVGQPTGEVEITAEPNHHQVLANSYVRVFDVSAPPKASTLVHWHRYDYAFVTLGDADLINARVGQKPGPLVLKDGDVRFTPGGFAHAITNQSDTVFRNITIELLQSSTNVKPCAGSCSVPLPCASANKSACPSQEQLITSDQWTLSRVTLPPSAILEKHAHRTPHLAVAVSDLNLTQKFEDGSAKELHGKPGTLNWVNPVVHTVVNSGPAEAKFVTLEFKQ
jgi:quercetin dioxygenase-like cupin family protein